MLFVFFLFVVAFGLAPLETGKNPIDQNGLRRYVVVLSPNAPAFGLDLERLRTWVAKNLSAVDPAKILDIWSIGSFAGFPVWLSSEGLDELRQHSYILKIAEDQIIRLHPMEMDTTNVTVGTGDDYRNRVDWGQMRAQQRVKDLTTIPPYYYVNISGLMYYPSGSAPLYDGTDDGSWNWNGPIFALPNTGSRGKIWVADTGINPNHQEFMDASGNTRIVLIADCTVGSCVPSSVVDQNGHGTHVAGSAAGRYRGLAPGAQIASLKVLSAEGWGAWSWSISGVNYAANHQDPNKFNILSLSLAGGAYDVMDTACNEAVAMGLTVVVAAGNDGGDACALSPARASQNTTYPTITVGATKASDYKWQYSNDGNCVTIFAPGLYIHSAWIGSPTTYATISGTSMATPLVSGAVAVLSTKYPNFNAASIRTLLYRFAPTNVIANVTSATNRFVYARAANTLDISDIDIMEE